MEEDIRIQRLKKLANIEKAGFYPFKETRFPSRKISDILGFFKESQPVETSARIVSLRRHGGSIFFDLEDFSGRIQGYIRKDSLGEEKFSFFLDNVDIGDILGVKGVLFKTRTGQVTIDVREFTVLSKSLRPLPEKWHGLKDTQLRYRKRYLDFIGNKDSRSILLKRVKIIDFLRDFFKSKGYLEVETPILQVLPGGARGKPFKTYHEAHNMELYLRIAPELYLKRLLVAGLRKVFEMGRNFRNEGISTRHNPEFTMLEAYCSYEDYNYMMNLLEELFVSILNNIYGGDRLVLGDKVINFAPPWKRISFAGVLKEKFGIEPDYDEKKIAQILFDKGKIKDLNLSRSQIVNLVEEIVEEEVGDDPVFVVDYYSHFSPLAKPKKDNPFIAERFELFISKMEIANAYSELNDPQLQRQRFLEEAKKDPEGLKKVDEDFLEALEYGMPPAAGLGIGVDRLVMLFASASSIKEVIIFPLLKPQD